ncbi:MAG: hypothetical protein UH824_06370 [Acutalibacteraceae bacterium]|nr:hypothetical protein [Acutalibacteraceae bacterium]
MNKSFIKSILALLVCVCIALSFSGCRRFLGAGILGLYGEYIIPQISTAEQYLSLDLSELDDSCIEYLDQSRHYDDIGYVSIICIYNDGLIKDIDARIKSAANWTPLPYDDDVKTLLSKSLYYEDYSFILDYTDGYYSVSGTDYNSKTYDFDRANQPTWDKTYIGVYDSEKDRIYIILLEREGEE